MIVPFVRLQNCTQMDEQQQPNSLWWKEAKGVEFPSLPLLQMWTLLPTDLFEIDIWCISIGLIQFR